MHITSTEQACLVSCNSSLEIEALYKFYLEELRGSMALDAMSGNSTVQDIVRDRVKVFDPELIAFDDVLTHHRKLKASKRLDEIALHLEMERPYEKYYLLDYPGDVAIKECVNSHNVGHDIVLYKDLIILRQSWCIFKPLRLGESK